MYSLLHWRRSHSAQHHKKIHASQHIQLSPPAKCGLATLEETNYEDHMHSLYFRDAYFLERNMSLVYK